MKGNPEEPIFLRVFLRYLQGKPQRRKDVAREGSSGEAPWCLWFPHLWLLQSSKRWLTSAEPREEGFRVHSTCFPSTFSFPSQLLANPSQPVSFRGSSCHKPLTSIRPGQQNALDPWFLESSSRWLPWNPATLLIPEEQLQPVPAWFGWWLWGWDKPSSAILLGENNWKTPFPCLNSLTCEGPAAAVVTLITELWGF